jgi:hypothetical protein
MTPESWMDRAAIRGVAKGSIHLGGYDTWRWFAPLAYMACGAGLFIGVVQLLTDRCLVGALMVGCSGTAALLMTIQDRAFELRGRDGDG